MTSKGMQTQGILIIEAFVTTLLILGIIGGIVARSGDFVKQETLDLQADKVVNAALAMDATPQGSMTVPMEEYGFKYDGEYIWIAFKNSEVNKSLELFDGSYDAIEGPPNYQLMEEQLLITKTENDDGDETLSFVADGTIGGSSTSSTDFEEIDDTDGQSTDRGTDSSDPVDSTDGDTDSGNNDGSAGSMEHGLYFVTRDELEEFEQDWLNGDQVDILTTTFSANIADSGTTAITFGDNDQDLREVFGETDRRLLMAYEFAGSDRGDYGPPANGEFDQRYRELARKLVDLGMEDTIIAPNHEFNLEWGAKSALDEPENYRDGYARLVREMMSIEGAEFTFVYAPAANQLGAAPDAWPVQSEYWPEDQEPPVVAPSFYDSWNQYPEDASSLSDSELEQLRREAWNENHKDILDMWRNFAEERNADMALREWGVGTDEWDNNAGLDNPYFIRKTFEYMREHDFRFQTYWNSGSLRGDSRTHQIYPPADLQDAGQEWKKQVLKDYGEGSSASQTDN